MTVLAISVVTVCLNEREGIRLTLESVARQTFRRVEHVIIDGGSEDGTQEIVREYPVGYFVSEKDNGVYAAMEKGAGAASGDVLIFLNAGDTFYDVRVCEDVAAFFNNSRADIVFGNLLPVYLRASDTHDHGAFTSGRLLDLGYLKNRRQLYEESIHHQATFYRRWIFKRCSYLCPEPAASGEYNLLLNAVMKQKARVKHIPRPVARFALGGISTRHFAVEWTKYVKARDILRRLYCPEPESIKVENEMEFIHPFPGAPAPRWWERSRCKQMLKQTILFRMYERLARSLCARTVNLLMPLFENMQEVQTQRLFNDLSQLLQENLQSQLTETRRQIYKEVNKSLHELQRQGALLHKRMTEMARQLPAVASEVEKSCGDLRHMGRELHAELAGMGSHLPLIATEVTQGFRDLRNTGARLQINMAGIFRKVNTAEDFSSHGFRVSSQWDEDGLIQYLISRAETARSFVEIGVGDYSEANTRFLLQEDNWSGLIIDSNSLNTEKVRASELYWRHSLEALAAFVDCENINQLLLENGVDGEIGLLSIDVDGVDYWLWKAIASVSAQIVICEYNGLFGSEAQVTVPYDPRFDRTEKHYSRLYAGASLAALNRLGHQKGYTLIGTNCGGNNAFFMRNDVLARSSVRPSASPYTRPMFREARNRDGSLSYLDIAKGIELIKDLDVYDVAQNRLVKIQKIPLVY